MNAPLLTIKDPSGLDVAALLQAVEKHSYAAVRGLFSKEEMRKLLASIKKGFDPARDKPGKGGAPLEVMQNFQKVIVGVGGQANYPVPRFLRLLYNPMWAPDIYGMHDAFRRLAHLRNRIQGHAPDFAIDGIEDKLWTASRLQHYPVGGGFFAPHRDAISPTMTQEAGLLKFIQILLLITERGTDYETGGAYIDVGENRVDLEALYGAGDVLVYDGRSMHGVTDIDPNKLPDLKTMNGRIVALVTLYADMTGDSKEYEQYRKRSFPPV